MFPSGSSHYRTAILTTRSQLADIGTAWERLRQDHPKPDIEHHPDWVLGLAASVGREAVAVALYRAHELVGVASFTLQRRHWRCRFGYKELIRFPVLFADLCGDTLLAPDDSVAHELLLSAVAHAPLACHTVFLECLPVDSSLWRSVHRSPVLNKLFWVYQPWKISQRRIIRITGTFQDYLKHFSSQTRGNFRRRVQKLERACEQGVTIDRITRRDQLPCFLDQIETISARSWQGTRLGVILRANNESIDHYGTLADRGWLRSYLLRNGGLPIAFVLGWQDAGVFYHDCVGYDASWRQFAPGTVLLYRLIEDLFTNNRPSYLDFRYGDSEYKRLFGTEAFGEANVFLIRKSFYTGVILAIDKAFNLTTGLIRRTLDYCGLRERVRRQLRGRPPSLSPRQDETAGDQQAKRR